MKIKEPEHKKIFEKEHIYFNYFEKIGENNLKSESKQLKAFKKIDDIKEEIEKLTNYINYKVIKQVATCINKVKNKQIIKAYYKNIEIFNIKDFEFNKNRENLLEKFLNY